MLKKSFFAFLLVAVTLSFSPVRQACAAEAKPSAALLGSWKITHRPVDQAGKPCPFLPESIEFFQDQTLTMSNIPGRHLPYKTELTAPERRMLEARKESYKGKELLLIKPNPKMDWSSTPMVYVYSVTKDGLALTAEGWEPSTFKRVK
jgi:hypothetical protein